MNRYRVTPLETEQQTGEIADNGTAMLIAQCVLHCARAKSGPQSSPKSSPSVQSPAYTTTPTLVLTTDIASWVLTCMCILVNELSLLGDYISEQIRKRGEVNYTANSLHSHLIHSLLSCSHIATLTCACKKTLLLLDILLLCTKTPQTEWKGFRPLQMRV